MTLVFVGHSFRYELEAVMKLFLPVESFQFITADLLSGIPKVEGDCAVVSRIVFSGMADLTAEVNFKGKSRIESEKIPLNANEYEQSCELILCRLMFLCLKDLTGISPPWGVLTGVRPVKLISRLLKSGMSGESIRRRMEHAYYVSPKKIDLCLETAKNQEKCLKRLPKKSASLYVSIPFCPSRCAYCSFVSQTVAASLRLIPEYIERLCDEISYTASLFNALGLRLDTVYFGGGTPTAVSASDIDIVMKTVSREFDLSTLREYTVEAGRPDTIDREKLSIILSNGGNRISVNPQTVQDSVLDKIGRKHTAAQFLESYSLARSMNFNAINVDLIAGLPSDSLSGFNDSLSKIIELGPENITVHTLSIKRSADIRFDDNICLSPDITALMIESADDQLESAGYLPYYLYRQKNQLSNLENVGWEKGGHPGIYNINMMEEVQSVIAVGAGGSTKTVAGQDNIERFYNPKYPLEYIKRFDETVIPRKKEAFLRLEKNLETTYGSE